jgi:replicative DNA helicase
MNNQRIPPHDLEAERALLGAMLVAPHVIPDVAQHVTADSFYRPAYGHIFNAVLAVDAAGSERPDTVTVADHLRQHNLLDAAGGQEELLSLMAGTPSTSNAASYAALVARHHQARQLIAAAGEIAELGYTIDSDDAVDQAEQMIFRLAAQRLESGRQGGVVRLYDTLYGWADRMEAREQQGGLAGIATGFHELDGKLLGLQPGQLITVAGRPGMGKSQLGAAIASNIAAQGAPALLASVEMALEELQDRFIASHSKVSLTNIRSGRLTPRDWEMITEALPGFDMPLYIDAHPTITLMRLRHAARRVAAMHGGHLGVIVVDYMQLMASASRHDNREREVSEISRGLKILAGELHTPVVALAQLNRNVEMRAEKRPTLSDLRESGSIENDSDAVLLLFRDEYYRPDTPDKGVCEVIVAKQRNGPTGTVRLFFEANRGSFHNVVIP